MTDYLIKDVLGVLNIVLDDVVGLPGNITESVVSDLTYLVRRPLDKVVELAKRKCSEQSSYALVKVLTDFESLR